LRGACEDESAQGGESRLERELMVFASSRHRRDFRIEGGVQRLPACSVQRFRRIGGVCVIAAQAHSSRSQTAKQRVTGLVDRRDIVQDQTDLPASRYCSSAESLDHPDGIT
jgi:hypothetical protein